MAAHEDQAREQTMRRYAELMFAMLVIPVVALAQDAKLRPGRATAIDDGVMIATDAQVKTTQPAPHDGKGITTAFPYFDHGETKKLAFRKRILHPGTTIGMHPMEPEEEVYYIVSGKGRFTANGKVMDVGPGTAILMRRGANVGLEPVGSEDLVLFIAYPR
jgi:mannose-6-phosphate isomerase-like protein (cupin superfamily)